MQIGIVGLGRMSGNMARRLMRQKHEVVVCDHGAEAMHAREKEGAAGAKDYAELVKKLNRPRVVWLMVPAGGPTEESVEAQKPLLESGDAIIDGGNSYFKDEAVPAEVLSASLFTHFRLRKEHTFAEKVLSAMCNKFGGHVESLPIQ
jgi:6-phosphogluconate dehydrogenase